MIWTVEYTDLFGVWWEHLSAAEQESVGSAVGLLERLGPDLPFPHSSGIASSRHRHLRELRVQHRGRPLRVLYAFDSRRVALLLLGGDKTGDEVHRSCGRERTLRGEALSARLAASDEDDSSEAGPFLRAHRAAH